MDLDAPPPALTLILSAIRTLSHYLVVMAMLS